MSDSGVEWAWRTELAKALHTFTAYQDGRERLAAARKALRHVEVARTILQALVRRLEAEEAER